MRYRGRFQPDQVAYTFLTDGETTTASLTYQALHHRATAIAAHLHSICSPGDRGLLLYPPGLDYIEAFFGCLYAGVVAVPAYLPSPNRSLSKLDAIAASADITVALTNTKTLSLLKRRISPSSELTHCDWVTTDTLSRSTQGGESNRIFPDTLALLQYTSGSTAAPKGVMITHQNLLHNLDAVAQGFAITPNSKGVIWLPPYHDMGLIGGILQPLYGGFSVILMSHMMFLQNPFRWLQAISRHQGTISGGPSFAYDFCVQKITSEQRDSLDLSHWQVAFNGAEPICPQVLERFAAMFGPCGFRPEAFYPCYGLAESTLMVTGVDKTAPPVVKTFSADGINHAQAEWKGGTKERKLARVGCGYPSPQQQLVIVNPQTHCQCAPGEVGEIWLAGPSVAQGYWRQPEKTQQTFRAYLADTGQGPFLRTGDLGRWDQGELFVTGRLKDMIIIHGCNHYPQDIERTVESHTSIVRPHSAAAFVVEVDGAERVVVAAELERRYWRLWKKNSHVSQGAQAPLPDNPQEFIQGLQNALVREHSLRPETILLLKPGSLPKTSSGKVQRYLCRDRFLADTLGALDIEQGIK